MKHILGSIAVVSLVFASGCVAQTGAPEEEIGQTESAIGKFLPPPFSEYQEAQTFVVNHCKFIIGTARADTSLPPQYFAWVWKGLAPGGGGTCTGSWGYQVLGYSYSKPAVSLVKHPTLPSLVTSYSQKGTPSGAAAVSVTIKTLAFADLSTTKTGWLGAMGTFSAGYVWNANLSIDRSGALIAVGDASGVIPGETGSGPHYKATYATWFTSASTVPTSVVRY